MSVKTDILIRLNKILQGNKKYIHENSRHQRLLDEVSQLFQDINNGEIIGDDE